MLAAVADVVVRPTTVLPDPVSLVDRAQVVTDLTQALRASVPGAPAARARLEAALPPAIARPSI